jgi:hypothetical protein
MVVWQEYGRSDEYMTRHGMVRLLSHRESLACVIKVASQNFGCNCSFAGRNIKTLTKKTESLFFSSREGGTKVNDEKTN